MVFFFFSSRRRHTRFDCDWSSDVCSSDLSSLDERMRHPVVLKYGLVRAGEKEEDRMQLYTARYASKAAAEAVATGKLVPVAISNGAPRFPSAVKAVAKCEELCPPWELVKAAKAGTERSEERRVGKESRSR